MLVSFRFVEITNTQGGFHGVYRGLYGVYIFLTLQAVIAILLLMMIIYNNNILCNLNNEWLKKP